MCSDRLTAVVVGDGGASDMLVDVSECSDIQFRYVPLICSEASVDQAFLVVCHT